MNSLLFGACSLLAANALAQTQPAAQPQRLAAPAFLFALEAGPGRGLGNIQYTQVGIRSAVAVRVFSRPATALYLRLPLDVGWVYFFNGGRDTNTIAFVPTVEVQIGLNETTALAPFVGGGLWTGTYECSVDCDGPFYSDKKHGLVRAGIGLRRALSPWARLVIDADLEFISQYGTFAGFHLGLDFDPGS